MSSLWEMSLLWFCAAGALLLVLGWWLYWAGLKLGAWMEKRPAPERRVWFYLVVSAILGAMLGGVLWWMKERVRPCHENPIPLGKCLFRTY